MLKKNMLILLSLLLVVTMVTPDFVYAKTQEEYDAELNQCQTTQFYVESVHENDWAVVGYAYKNQTTSLTINGVYYETVADQNGRFLVNIQQTLTAGESVHVKQGLNTLQSTVKEEDVARTNEYYYGAFNCEGMIGPVTVFPEPEVEEVVVSEEIEDVKDDENVVAEDEKEEADKTAEEKVKNEEADEKNGTDKKEALEEEKDADTKDAEKKDEDVEKEEAEKDTDKNTTVDKEELAVTSRSMSANVMTTTFESTSTSSKNRYTTCPTLAQYRADNPTDAVNGPIRTTIHSIICVSNASEFNSAIISSTTSAVILLNDITQVYTNTSTYNLLSPHSQKVIDGNGYSLTMGSSSRLQINNRNLTNLVFINFENITSYNRVANEGFVRSNYQANINFVNSNFNINNIETVGNLGYGLNSVFNFYGENIVNFKSGSGDDRYGLQYRQVNVRNNSNTHVTSDQNAFWARSVYQSQVTNISDYAGLIVGNNAMFNVVAPTTVFHIRGENVGSSSGDRESRFIVGENSTVNLRGGYALHYNSRAKTEINIGRNSYVNLESRWESGLKLPANDTNITIQEYAKLDIIGPEHGINDYNASRLGSNTTFNVHENATLIVRNDQRYVTGETPAVKISGTTTFNIVKPEMFVIESVNGRAFHSPNSGAWTYIFNIEQSDIRSWAYDRSAQYVGQVVSGGFEIRNGSIVNIRNLQGDVDFRPYGNMSRLDIEATKLDNPVINEPIYDTSLTVTGKGKANAVVKMRNERTGDTLETTVNSDDTFSFDVSALNFQAGDVLTFSLSLGELQSDEVEAVVVGNQLELIQPADIVFETTGIQNEPNKIIQRTTSNYAVSVLNTKSNNNWQVSVQAMGPLSDGNGEQITNALIFKNGDSIQSLENGSVQVMNASNSEEDNFEYTAQWGPDEGVLLQMNPIEAKANTSYTTKLNWTLTDGP